MLDEKSVELIKERQRMHDLKFGEAAKELKLLNKKQIEQLLGENLPF